MTAIPPRFDFDKLALRGDIVEDTRRHYAVLRSDGYHDQAELLVTLLAVIDRIADALMEGADHIELNFPADLSGECD